MRRNLRGHWCRQSLAAWKFTISFFKRSWRFEDYPVALWPQTKTPGGTPERRVVHPWRATITNWEVSGSGETQAAAIEDLRKRFDLAKVHRDKMPRPGAKVPIEFSATDRVDRHSELAENFVREILGLEWAWISNESSLWDFHSDPDNSRYIGKIRETYAVDVSDIEGASLADIFDRIAESRR